MKGKKLGVLERELEGFLELCGVFFPFLTRDK